MTRLLFIDPFNLSNSGDLQLANGYQVEILPGPLTPETLERALREQYDAVHWFGHGLKGLLKLSESAELDAADFVSMLGQQRCLRFVFLNACNGSQVASMIHNALHVPVIAHDNEIKTVAARAFAGTFYRRYKQSNSVGEAFDAAQETLLRHPNKYVDQATIPILLNGDMATKLDINECMAYVRTEICALHAKLDDIEADMKELKSQQSRPLLVGLVLLALLLVAQVATPFIQLAR